MYVYFNNINIYAYIQYKRKNMNKLHYGVRKDRPTLRINRIMKIIFDIQQSFFDSHHASK